MFKKYLIIISMILCLFITGCNYCRNPFIKYYKVFPTKTQYDECFENNFECGNEEISEETFNSRYGSDKFVSWAYEKIDNENDDGETFLGDIENNIVLLLTDKYDHLSNADQSWIGDFDEEHQLEKNEHFSLYYSGWDGTTYSLYGKLYYPDFEMYFFTINYSENYQLVEDHLDESINYLNKLYNLIDSNRIEAGL